MAPDEDPRKDGGRAARSDQDAQTREIATHEGESAIEEPRSTLRDFGLFHEVH